MAVPENIEELAHQIRTAIYGRDVRESIASGLEATADVADWARQVAQDIIDGNFDESALITEIERKLNELEANYAPELTSLREEIENSKGEFPTLSDRFVSIINEINQVRNEEATETTLGRVKVDGATIKVDSGTISTRNNTRPVLTPEGFGWQNHPLKNKIFTDGYGNFHLKDFDLEKHKPDGKVLYVDVKNGSDSNDGLTQNSALESVRTAYDDPECTVIKVAEGIYHREQFMWARKIDRDLTIEALHGHDVILTGSFPVNWSPMEGRNNVYSGTTTNVAFFLDLKHKDEYGDYKKYVLVNSIDEVESTPGSYYVDSSLTYIHTYDSDEPKNESVLRFANGLGLWIDGDNITVFLKGLKLWGGDRALFAENETGSGGLKVFAKDCEFKYSNNSTFDVVLIQGADLAVFENCSAIDGLKDGFNYTPLNGVPTNAIEINCIGKRNGTEGDGDDQGSTMHGGGKAIRINGVYSENNGSNIADVHEGTQSWNMGCIGFNSRSGNDSQRANFYAYPLVDMWLDGCVGYDVGENGSDVAGAGNIHLRNNNLLSPNAIAQESNTSFYK